MVNLLVWLVTVVCVLARIGLCGAFVPNNVWVNTDYQKVVDVKHAYVNEGFLITIKNVATEPQNEYYLAIPEEVFLRISLFEVQLTKKNAFVNASLFDKKTTLDDGTIVGYGLVTLPSAVEPGKEVSLTVKYSHTAHGIPYPERILLQDEQHLRLCTPRLPFSAYQTDKSTLQLLGSKEFTELNPPEDLSLQGIQQDEVFHFPSWVNIKPFETGKKLDFVYSHNLPIIEVLNLKRDIWISHWASTLQFEEYYELINRSAKLKNGFSRLELMRDQKGMRMSHYCPVIELNLPAEASEHYYTDLVGMVSTSRVLGDSMYIKPRYPLFGNWKYNFTVGWTNELSNSLRKTSEDTYILAVPLLNGPTDALYKQAEISFFLPENAIVEAIDSSIPMKEVKINSQKSYLDLNKGHIKVSCNFENLVDANRAAQIVVKYSYSSQAAYKKPLSIACYIFSALIGFFTLKCMNINLNKK